LVAAGMKVAYPICQHYANHIKYHTWKYFANVQYMTMVEYYSSFLLTVYMTDCLSDK